MATYEVLIEAVIKGDLEEAESQTRKAVDEGTDARSILVNGLIAGMEVVDKRFKSGEMFLPEVMVSGAAMHKGLDILKPLLDKSDQQEEITIVMGAVERLPSTLPS